MKKNIWNILEYFGQTNYNLVFYGQELDACLTPLVVALLGIGDL